MKKAEKSKKNPKNIKTAPSLISFYLKITTLFNRFPKLMSLKINRYNKLKNRLQ